MQKNKLSSDWLNEVKAKNDIVDTISSYIPVIKKGRSYWSRCPFHHEKTPSFAINNDEQYYHCFGCGESGDVITFVEKMESISTRDAIRKLAEKAGVEMPVFESGEKIAIKKKQKDEVLKALKLTKDFYVKKLYENSAKPAQEYIKKRGFKKSDLDRFEIGYSKENSIIPYLESNGVSRETMLSAGITGISRNDKLYDHVYNRLVFPIFNTFGDCVGFSGRLLENDSEKAKYKNTSQTIVFDKSSLIYGLHLLKEAKRKGEVKNIILVEGQIDVIMMHSYGFNTAIASLGTAFTEKHAEQLKRVDENIILLFDNDSAGEKATLRAIEILKPLKFNIKVARLPIGSDPDDFLKKNGADAMKVLLEKAKSPIEYQLDLFKESLDLNKTEDKTKYVRRSLNLISQLSTMSEREVYFKIISENSSVPIDILRRDSNVKKTYKPQENESDVLINNENGNIKAVRYIVASILRGESFSKLNFDIKKYIFNPKYKEIILKYQKINNDIQDFDKVFLKTLEDDEKELVNELLEESYIPDKKYFDECVWKLAEELLLTEQSILNDKYKNAETKEERFDITKKLSEIVKQLRNKKIY